MSIIVVPKHADMQAASVLHGVLLADLDEHPVVTLDVGEVVEADLSFLQLVEAGRREAARRGKTLAFATPVTGALRTALDRAGFLAGPPQDAIDFWFHGDLPR